MLDSPCDTKINLTNGVTLKFNGKTILQHFCKDRDYFEFNIKLGTNMQNGYNLKDKIAYSLFWKILNFKNFKYFNWNSFIFKILCLDKKIKIVKVKKNECK